MQRLGIFAISEILADLVTRPNFCVDFYLAVQIIPIIPHTPASHLFRSWDKVLIRTNSARFLMYTGVCRTSRYRSIPVSVIAISQLRTPNCFANNLLPDWRRVVASPLFQDMEQRRAD